MNFLNKSIVISKNFALRINTLASYFKLKLLTWQKKKFMPFVKLLPRRFMNIFAENLYGIWLLRKWASVVGYILALSVSLGAMIIVDSFGYARFLHISNVNDTVIGVFTILLALLIPLAIALIQGDNNNSFARQTMVKTIIRFRDVSFILLLICVGLIIPSGIHLAGESLTLKNLYTPVLVLCLIFIWATFYRSIRWLSDESVYSSGLSGDTPPKNPSSGGFSSYRFAWIVRLLKDTKGFQTWMAIWSQWFPIGYEETIHQAFFDRQYEIVNKKRRKQYRILSLELDAYDKDFDKRNQYGYKFEYENPEKFFTLHRKIEQILEEKYVDSRMDGLWQGKEAASNISTKYINALMTKHRVWSLFESMSKYLKNSDLIEMRGDKIRKDEQLETFLTAVFDAIKDDKISTHDASEHFSKAGSVWAVTHDNLYGATRNNLSFLVQNIYWEWLKSVLDKQKDKEFFFKNDSIVEMVFPEADPITIGKLYWLLYLGSSSDYLDLWIKRFRPIGLMGASYEFYEVTESKDEEYKTLYENISAQEYNSIKLFCSLYWRYIRTNFLDLAENIKTAKNIDRSTLSEVEIARLDDFISLAESILKFYEDDEKKAKVSSKKTKH